MIDHDQPPKSTRYLKIDDEIFGLQSSLIHQKRVNLHKYTLVYLDDSKQA